MSSSIRVWMYNSDNNSSLTHQEIRTDLNTNLYNVYSYRGERDTYKRCGRNCFLIAVHRDPVERFISCYRDRVLNLGRAPRMRLEHFVEQIHEIRSRNKDIEWHTDLQSSFLKRSSLYDAVIPFHLAAWLLPVVVAQFTGKQSATIPHVRKSSTLNPQIGIHLRKNIEALYETDYENGWDGTSLILPGSQTSHREVLKPDISSPSPTKF
ncbi:sulfotransferase family 2 domain-containing protein [Rhodopirellula halodulae]|nr:sulfotransferase family 2 domain-containing protein [Rhodopirellula sp. JC740]